MPFKVPTQFTDVDRAFSLKLIELWTSFSRNGKMPNQSSGKQWPTSNKCSPTLRYVEINANYTREKKFEFEDRCDLVWRPLLPFYRK